MNRLWSIVTLLLLLTAPAHGQSIVKILRGAADLADLANTGQDTDKPAPSGTPERIRSVLYTRPDARGLLVEPEGLALIQPNGSKGVLATTKDERGLRLDDEVAAQLSKTDLFVIDEQVTELGGVIRQLDSMRQGGVLTLRSDGTFGRLRFISGTRGEELISEYLDHIYVSNTVAQRQTVADLLNQSVRRSSMRVISLLDADESDGRQALDQTLGPLHTSATGMKSVAIANLMRRGRHAIVFVVGHVDGAAFVVKDAAGAAATVSIADLEAGARSVDAKLLVLGCAGSACWNGADLGEDYVRAIPDSLRAIPERASFGEVLGELARSGSNLLVRPGVADSRRAQLTIEALPGRDPHYDDSLRYAEAMLVEPALNAELSRRLLPGVPSMIQFAYLAGLAILLFSVKSVFAGWRSFWQPLPTFKSAPLACTSIVLTRGLGFLLLMPVVACITLALALAPWGAALLSLSIEPYAAIAAALVGIYFGVRWYRQHSARLGEEAWQRRYLAIPLFSLALSLPLAIAGWLVLKLLQSMEIDASVVHWTLFGSAATCAFALGRFVMRWVSNWHWAPADVIDAVHSAPLWGIEYVAQRPWRR